MKILALADIHGEYRKAEEIINVEPADVVIIGGDLTTVGSVREAEEAIQRFQSSSKRLLAVAGNMDLPQHDELFARLGVSINGCGVVIDDIGFFGVSAAPHSPLHTPYEISEEKINDLIQAGYTQVEGCRVKIFVPHAPPYGTKVDITHSALHVGSTAVRDFIETTQPDVVICGHIHEARGQDICGKTKIINCGPVAKGYYGVVEVGGTICVKNLQLSAKK